MSRGTDGSRTSLVLRLVLVGFGVMVLAIGVLALFSDRDATASGLLIAVGATLTVLGIFGSRIESLAVGPVKVTFGPADQAEALADAAEQRGDLDSAETLHRAARRLRQLSDQYRGIRSLMPSDARRVTVLEELMAETRVLATSAAFPPEDVRTWFREGSPEYRITAIGLMEGDARVRDLDAVVTAITAPLSAFEQFHALVVAERMVTSGSLTNVERTLLRQSIQAALRGGSLDQSSDRYRLGTRSWASSTKSRWSGAAEAATSPDADDAAIARNQRGTDHSASSS